MICYAYYYMLIGQRHLVDLSGLARRTQSAAQAHRKTPDKLGLHCHMEGVGSRW
jgi:hypothetical protein